MTEVQNFMLVVCFGCTIGFLIGTFSIMVSDGIHYLKKRMRMKKEQKEQNNEYMLWAVWRITISPNFFVGGKLFC